jgi:hypothetical protein
MTCLPNCNQFLEGVVSTKAASIAIFKSGLRDRASGTVFFVPGRYWTFKFKSASSSDHLA